jgi:predicted transposase/invertase (TIGR01784 family)
MNALPEQRVAESPRIGRGVVTNICSVTIRVVNPMCSRENEAMASRPLGIRPTNDFAYKKTFGSQINAVVLVSLLNAILKLRRKITEVTIENPFNPKDFQEDKLTVLDIKAIDETGAIYDVEMQLETHPGLIPRIVFYGCELYAGQLKTGDNYQQLKPVFAICLLEGKLWNDSRKVHHALRLTDRETGRTLDQTIEFHTLELGWYTLKESELAAASPLERWLYWLVHAHKYTADGLLALFPEREFQQATRTLMAISEITEDKQMYDAAEKARRDYQWGLNASRAEGELEGMIKGEREGMIKGEREGMIKGEIKLIRTLEELLGQSAIDELQLSSRTLEELQAITFELQAKLRYRKG